MLNARLYRLAWLVAGVALVVALLTLESPRPAPEPALPPAFDGRAARVLAEALQAVVPERPAGSPADRQAADWVAERFAEVPGVRPDQVTRSDFAVRVPGGRAVTENVALSLPSRTGAAVGGAILVVAPRDTPPGVSGGATGTAVLVQLARTFASAAHDRPIIFLSSGASTLGNAGVRWYLARNRRAPVAATLALDAPAEGSAPGPLHLWTLGRTDAQSVALGAAAEQAVRRAGGRVAAAPGAWAQLARMAVPQTVGDQGPPIAAGIPAVTMSGRPESPLRSDPTPPSEDRLQVAGAAAETLIGSVDATDRVVGPVAAITISGRELRPVIGRIALLLVALPFLVAAADTLRRLRRARVRTGPALAALGWRSAAVLAGVGSAYLLTLLGVLPIPAGGAPPGAWDVPFDALAGLGVVLSLLAGAGVWLLVRGRVRRLDAQAPVRAGVAVVALAALLLVLWLTRPFALVLALPAAHAGLIASVARRGWQVAVCAAVAVAPLVALCVTMSGLVGRGTPFAGWYVLETTAAGARGWAGPVLAVLVAVSVWTMGGLVAFRARKGLVAADSTGRARRRRRAARSEARTIDDRPRRR